jgi:hypothetical protein
MIPASTEEALSFPIWTREVMGLFCRLSFDRPCPCPRPRPLPNPLPLPLLTPRSSARYCDDE